MEQGEEGWLVGNAGSGRGPRGFPKLLRLKRSDGSRSVALLRLEHEVVEAMDDQDVRLEFDSAGETGEASVSSSSKSWARSSRARSIEESSEQIEDVDQIEAARGRGEL